MKLRTFIAGLLALLLAIQPAFAAGLPRCAHDAGHAHATAATHEGHGGHQGSTHQHGHHDESPKPCDCGCLGMMAGCAHAGATVAMSGRIDVAARVIATEAPAPVPDPAHPSARSEPPLRPPTPA